jgi:hypothetical protein
MSALRPAAAVQAIGKLLVDTAESMAAKYGARPSEWPHSSLPAAAAALASALADISEIVTICERDVLPALPGGWRESTPGCFDLAAETHTPVQVRTGFDFAPGVPTTRFSAYHGDVYVPDIVLAHRLAALGWSVSAPEVQS